MICKWCGATVDVTKGKCLSCGKSIPPISDCGGFYNVAPKATRMSEQTSSTDQPQVQSVLPQKVVPMTKENMEAPKKSRINIPLIIGIAIIAIACIVSLVQTGALSNRIAALERANVQNSDAIGELTRSIESVSSRLSSVEDQLEEQESQPPEETEADPSLEEQALSFFVFADSDGKYMWNSSIAAEINFDSNDRNATVFFAGERLWEARLYEQQSSMPSTVSQKTYVFSYDIADDILGSYAQSIFTWKYRICGTSKWEVIGADEAGVSREDNLSESTSTIILSSEWMEEHAYDGELELECVVERNSKAGGSIKIEFGTSLEDATIPEQD